MKLLIISSSDPIFLSMAKFFSQKILENHEVVIVKESVRISLFYILLKRIKKFGFLSGLSQFAFKVFDVLLLRKSITQDAIQSLGDFDCKQIDSINSTQAKCLVSEFDAVICIATSIVRQSTLDSAKNGLVNVHPGILPNYRGTGNFWAVVNRDWNNIGCTCHWMTSKIDDGKVILCTKTAATFNSLWEMNYNAMLEGLDALSKVINEDKLLDSSIDLDMTCSAYYTWYGFCDYFSFLASMRCLNRQV